MSIENFSWVIPNKLAGSALPGGRLHASAETVLVDLLELNQQGIKCIVSLQRMSQSFGSLCEQVRLEWIHYPITDFESPDNICAFNSLVDAIIAHINQDVPVCVHCRAGIGRTGLLLSCVTGKYFGISADSAITSVRKNRSLLDTTEQTRFVYTYLNTWLPQAQAQ